eukprot:s427_g3.t1
MCLLWLGFAVTACVVVRNLRKDVESCWSQVADEDRYMTQVESRVMQLEMKCETVKEQRTENSNEISLTHDYATGIHYAVVESGGFLRNGLGLTHDQWIHLNTLERANMVVHCTMGSGDFMRLVRQRTGPRGSAETTDDPRAAHQQGEESESEENDVEMEVVLHLRSWLLGILAGHSVFDSARFDTQYMRRRKQCHLAKIGKVTILLQLCLLALPGPQHRDDLRTNFNMILTGSIDAPAQLFLNRGNKQKVLLQARGYELVMFPSKGKVPWLVMTLQ